MEQSVKSWEKVLTGIVLYLFLKTLPFAFYLHDFDLVDPSEETKTMLRLFWLFADVLILILVLHRWRFVLKQSLRNPLLMLLILLIFSSALWSISPWDTLRRSIAFFISSIFGIYLAERYSHKDLLQILAWVLGITMVSCWIFSIFFPDIGLMTSKDNSAWRGTFSHKNPMGMGMLLTGIVFFFVSKETTPSRVLCWVGILLSFLLVLLSDSKAALLLGLLLVPVYFLLHHIRAYSQYSVPFGMLAFCWFALMGFVAFDNIELLMGKMGRDFTLTGRDQIWAEVWQMIQVHFWMGYGYKAFWLAEGGPAEDIWKNVKWVFMEAHNGFLELWLGIGLIGLCLFMGIFMVALLKSLRHYRNTNLESDVWSILFLLMYFLINIIESYFLNEHNLYWVLFVAMAAKRYQEQHFV